MKYEIVYYLLLLFLGLSSVLSEGMTGFLKISVLSLGRSSSCQRKPFSKSLPSGSFSSGYNISSVFGNILFFVSDF